MGAGGGRSCKGTFAKASVAAATAAVAGDWDLAARVGLADPRLRDAAVQCVAAAAEHAPPDLAVAMDRLLTDAEAGRCPGDEFTDRVVKLQTGYLYHYAFAMLIGVAGLITWFMFGLGGQ